MTTTYTLGSTGRQIANALSAGKSIMIHISLNGVDSYITPGEITFSTSGDSFYMSVVLEENLVQFHGDLNSELVASSGDSGGGGIK